MGTALGMKGRKMLINKDEMVAELGIGTSCHACPRYEGNGVCRGHLSWLCGAINRMPEAIVRCKDCKWWKTTYSWNGNEHKVCAIEAYEPLRKAEDFCSRGERREDGKAD